MKRIHSCAALGDEVKTQPVSVMVVVDPDDEAREQSVSD